MDKQIIKIENIRKIYKVGNQEVRALDGVDININKNEYVAIMGPSGSGKSTLMNILGCLDTPTSGLYVLNGTDVSKMKDSELAVVRNKEIGFIFQSFNLLPRYTALDNVALPLIYSGESRKQRDIKATDALTKVELSDRMHHKPNELSGGQRQRVAVARALINDPSIILADEPTGNLDSSSSKEIMELFRQLNSEGKTVIIVTHERDIAEYTDRIITFKDGEIIKDEGRESFNVSIWKYKTRSFQYKIK